MEKISKLNLDITQIKQKMTLSEDELRKIITDSEKKSKDDPAEQERVYSAFALCNKVTRDVFGYSPFIQQIQAAFGLYTNNIVEMKTGEGKTLSAVFAAYLAVLAKHRVHILTFNDYLAARDCEWMRPVYEKLGVRVSHISETMTREQRKKAYYSNVVYGTAKEFGFDYQRDQIVFDVKERIMPKLDFGIVDEADSVMIDEARLPLVIAGTQPVKQEENERISEVVKFLKTLSDTNYKITKNRTVYLLNSGASECEKHYKIENLYDAEHADLLYTINDCLKAVFLLKENKDYVVTGNNIRLIDEYTGRVAVGRQFPGILQTAVEMKHNLKVTKRGVTLGSMPIQFFLDCYRSLSGMTGTTTRSETEFNARYALPVVTIPPHIASRREDRPIKVYFDKESKKSALVREILDVHKTGQPILLGTTDISESEEYEKLLRDGGIENLQVLNAKNDAREAEIISSAGKLGMVTISTNMAGRGIDIKLGGGDKEEYDKVSKLGGLFIISTELQETGRMNDQLFGRCGRQGDVGCTQQYCALDDTVPAENAIMKLLPIFSRPKPTSERLTNKTVIKEVYRTQRINEGESVNKRKLLVEYTGMCDQHRKLLFKKRESVLVKPLEEYEPMGRQKFPNLYAKLEEKYGADRLKKFDRDVMLYAIDTYWSEYISFAADTRTAVQLVVLSKKSPTQEYSIKVRHYFEHLEEEIAAIMKDEFKILSKLGDISFYKLKRPEHIHTHIIDDTDAVMSKKGRFDMYEMSEEDLKEFYGQ